jgi:uncharacterized repeat protein (TIGR03803 family)
MPDGSAYSILHSFTNRPDGATPFAGLVQGIDGALYGTTYAGGSNFIGTVFTINTNGSACSVLHHFLGLPYDGFSPEATLVQGTNGALYGTTVSGDTNGFGIIFKLNTNGGAYSRLYSFTNSPDGANSYASLALGGDGALYGTTDWGGRTNGGTIFKLNQDGTGYSVVYHFGGIGDGSHPFAGLTGRTAGALYGTTMSGGTNGFGTVYRLTFVPSLGLASSGQSAQVTVSGFAGQSCRLQATTNLTDWLTVTNLVLTNGSSQFLDTGGLPFRFYRIAVP